MLGEEADRRASIHEEIGGEYGFVVDASTISQMEECVGNHTDRLAELENVISAIQTRLNSQLHQIISLVSENRPQTIREQGTALRCVSSEVKNIADQIKALGVGDFAAQMATISQMQSRLGTHASQLQDQFNKIQSDVQMQTLELKALKYEQSGMKATLGGHIANLDYDLDSYHKELQQVRDSHKRTDELLQKFLKTQSSINDKLTDMVSAKLTEIKVSQY
jgi:chromosome segregation ATPase